jgi:hypothetical protein
MPLSSLTRKRMGWADKVNLKALRAWVNAAERNPARLVGVENVFIGLARNFRSGRTEWPAMIPDK